MQTEQFIRDLSKELGVELSFRQNPNYPSMGMVFFSGVQICSAPFREIFAEVIGGYTNEAGDVHPTQSVVSNKIKLFIHKWKNEQGFKELMTEKV